MPKTSQAISNIGVTATKVEDQSTNEELSSQPYLAPPEPTNEGQPMLVFSTQPDGQSTKSDNITDTAINSIINEEEKDYLVDEASSFSTSSAVVENVGGMPTSSVELEKEREMMKASIAQLETFLAGKYSHLMTEHTTKMFNNNIFNGVSGAENASPPVKNDILDNLQDPVWKEVKPDDNTTSKVAAAYEAINIPISEGITEGEEQKSITDEFGVVDVLNLEPESTSAINNTSDILSNEVIDSENNHTTDILATTLLDTVITEDYDDNDRLEEELIEVDSTTIDNDEYDDDIIAETTKVSIDDDGEDSIFENAFDDLNNINGLNELSDEETTVATTSEIIEMSTTTKHVLFVEEDEIKDSSLDLEDTLEDDLEGEGHTTSAEMNELLGSHAGSILTANSVLLDTSLLSNVEQTNTVLESNTDSNGNIIITSHGPNIEINMVSEIQSNENIEQGLTVTTPVINQGFEGENLSTLGGVISTSVGEHKTNEIAEMTFMFNQPIITETGTNANINTVSEGLLLQSSTDVSIEDVNERQSTTIISETEVGNVDTTTHEYSSTILHEEILGEFLTSTIESGLTSTQETDLSVTGYVINISEKGDNDVETTTYESIIINEDHEVQISETTSAQTHEEANIVTTSENLRYSSFHEDFSTLESDDVHENGTDTIIYLEIDHLSDNITVEPGKLLMDINHDVIATGMNGETTEILFTTISNGISDNIIQEDQSKIHSETTLSNMLQINTDNTVSMVSEMAGENLTTPKKATIDLNDSIDIIPKIDALLKIFSTTDSLFELPEVTMIPTNESGTIMITNSTEINMSPAGLLNNPVTNIETVNQNMETTNNEEVNIVINIENNTLSFPLASGETMTNLVSTEGLIASGISSVGNENQPPHNTDLNLISTQEVHYDTAVTNHELINPTIISVSTIIQSFPEVASISISNEMLETTAHNLQNTVMSTVLAESLANNSIILTSTILPMFTSETAGNVIVETKVPETVTATEISNIGISNVLTSIHAQNEITTISVQNEGTILDTNISYGNILSADLSPTLLTTVLSNTNIAQEVSSFTDNLLGITVSTHNEEAVTDINVQVTTYSSIITTDYQDHSAMESVVGQESTTILSENLDDALHPSFHHKNVIQSESIPMQICHESNEAEMKHFQENSNKSLHGTTDHQGLLTVGYVADKNYVKSKLLDSVMKDEFNNSAHAVEPDSQDDVKMKMKMLSNNKSHEHDDDTTDEVPKANDGDDDVYETTIECKIIHIAKANQFITPSEESIPEEEIDTGSNDESILHSSVSINPEDNISESMSVDNPNIESTTSEIETPEGTELSAESMVVHTTHTHDDHITKTVSVDLETATHGAETTTNEQANAISTATTQIKSGKSETFVLSTLVEGHDKYTTVSSLNTESSTDDKSKLTSLDLHLNNAFASDTTHMDTSTTEILTLKTTSENKETSTESLVIVVEETKLLPESSTEIATVETSSKELVTVKLTTHTTTVKTTEEPTTLELTTEEPTILELTTEEPTTLELTTKEPTTLEITTVEPTTLQLTTEKPSTLELTTEESTTLEITTEELTTLEITTEEQTTIEITTEEPTTLEITTEEPTTLELTTEEPTTLELTTEEPTTIEITTEEPTTLEITTEEPTTLELTTEEPTTLEITTEEPTTIEEIEEVESTTSTTRKITTHSTTEEPTTTEVCCTWMEEETTLKPTIEESITELPSTESTTHKTSTHLTTTHSTTTHSTTKHSTTTHSTTTEETTREPTIEETSVEPTTEEQITLEETLSEMTSTTHLTTAHLTTKKQTTQGTTTEEILTEINKSTELSKEIDVTKHVMLTSSAPLVICHEFNENELGHFSHNTVPHKELTSEKFLSSTLKVTTEEINVELLTIESSSLESSVEEVTSEITTKHATVKHTSKVTVEETTLELTTNLEDTELLPTLETTTPELLSEETTQETLSEEMVETSAELKTDLPVLTTKVLSIDTTSELINVETTELSETYSDLYTDELTLELSTEIPVIETTITDLQFVPIASTIELISHTTEKESTSISPLQIPTFSSEITTEIIHIDEKTSSQSAILITNAEVQTPTNRMLSDDFTCETIPDSEVCVSSSVEESKLASIVSSTAQTSPINIIDITTELPPITIPPTVEEISVELPSITTDHIQITIIAENSPEGVIISNVPFTTMLNEQTAIVETELPIITTVLKTAETTQPVGIALEVNDEELNNVSPDTTDNNITQSDQLLKHKGSHKYPPEIATISQDDQDVDFKHFNSHDKTTLCHLCEDELDVTSNLIASSNIDIISTPQPSNDLLSLLSGQMSTLLPIANASVPTLSISTEFENISLSLLHTINNTTYAGMGDMPSSVPPIWDSNYTTPSDIPEVYIDLPTYFPNSTAPMENFENYYTTEQKMNDLFDDEQNDTTLNIDQFRSMKLHDFDEITEHRTTPKPTETECDDFTCGRVTTEFVSILTVGHITERDKLTTHLLSTTPKLDTTEIIKTSQSITTQSITTQSITTQSITTQSITTQSHVELGETLMNEIELDNSIHQAVASEESIITVTDHTNAVVITDAPLQIVSLVSNNTQLKEIEIKIGTESTVEDIETTCWTEIIRIGKEMDLDLQLATPGSVGGSGKCGKEEFDAKKSCMCSIDNMLKDLKMKSSEKEFKEIMDKYSCNSFIPLHTGIVLGKSRPQQHKRSKRDTTDSNLKEVTVHKREVIQNAEISRALDNDFQITSTDKLVYALPGSEVKIACAPPPLESTSGKWTFNGKSLTEGKIREGDGFLSIDTIVPQDGGNYTCTDPHGLVHVHTLSVITLPFFIINASILYDMNEHCDDTDAELVQKFFNDELSDMFCGSDQKICNLVVHNTMCIHKASKDYLETTLELAMEPVDNIMPSLNKKECDVTCQLKMYSKMAGIVVKNVDIFESQPVYFNESNNKNLTLKPTEAESNADNIGTAAAKLIISCAPGFGLIPNSHICEACVPNTFSGGDEAFCAKCPQSTYQPMAGSKSCLTCSNVFEDVQCLRGIIMEGQRFEVFIGLATLLVVILLVMLVATLTRKDGSKDPTDCGGHSRSAPKKRDKRWKKGDIDVEKQDDSPWTKNDKRKHNDYGSG